MKTYLLKASLGATLAFSLSGCAMLDKFGLNEITQKFNPKATVESTKLVANWQAPLPHGGQISNLNEFWQRYPNPVLLEFIISAQKNAPTLATALANLADAHANRTRSDAARQPKLDANASASRALQQPKDIEYSGESGSQYGNVGSFGLGSNQPSNTTQIGLQASWELDLYSANKALSEAGIRQEDAAKAGWHEARVAVAAEVATSYFNYMLCTQQYLLLHNIAASQGETARLTKISYDAGFSNANQLALAQANFADMQQQAKQQFGQCEVEVKNLVALTYMEEPTVRQKLAEAAQTVPKVDLSNLFVIGEIPAEVLAQRPDVYRAEAELLRTAANVKDAAARHYPKVTLNGSIGWMRLSSASFKSDGTVWSLGPVSVTLPIFDGGILKANQEAAEARYFEAAAKYRSVVQTAVKETESALVNLHATSERQKDVAIALQKLQANIDAAETRYKAGFASKIDVEETKRALMSAQKNALGLQQGRANAWLNLYRAAGGGWTPGMPIANLDTQISAPEAKLDAASGDAINEGKTNAKE